MEDVRGECGRCEGRVWKMWGWREGRVKDVVVEGGESGRCVGGGESVEDVG